MNYYFIMDDKSNKTFNFDVEYGRVDFEIQKKPYEEEWTKPIDYIYNPNCPDVIYYNFVNKKQYINKIRELYTSLHHHQHIVFMRISKKTISVLEVAFSILIVVPF